ncbi:MAG: 23S rRNA (pseudouridine(1915)-N(3))-methyltransferase RlmH [Bacteroidales bacterium]|nr:23S rRNA (pseudouridine(1915)-N(3))-methyltransferase RlmH [Bacteroidales bacterium]MBR3500080.1 23S rRNA (pseudouridine(1915)-N(3))-methyltransferase RlmH [Bacteroidales bacterium]
MRVSLITVGKTDIKWVSEGLEVYSSRLRHYIPFEIREIPELKNVSALSRDQIKTAEGKLILKSLKDSDDLILLDERGKEFRSIEFADWLQKRMTAGRDIVFVIGGAYGFSQEVYQRAGGMVSLSKMTFSHQMVRTIFVEQLYRALTILKGESYHHE